MSAKNHHAKKGLRTNPRPGPNGFPSPKPLHPMLRSLLSCPLCGRSGGHLGRDCLVCSKCRGELAPTPLQAWREALGMTVAEVARLAGVAPSTWHRAAAGRPVGRAAAEAISQLTSVPADVLRAGVPPPESLRPTPSRTKENP